MELIEGFAILSLKYPLLLKLKYMKSQFRKVGLPNLGRTEITGKLPPGYL